MLQRNGASRSATLGASLLAAAMLAGCGGGSGESAQPIPAAKDDAAVPPAVMQAKDANTPVDPALVSADNAFGLTLLNTLIQSNAGNNTAIAPVSVSMALQIVYNGAVGTTQTAMAQTLQLGGLGVQQLNTDNAALLASLLDPDPQVTLTIANSLWIPLSSDTVSSSFTSVNENYYGSEIGDIAGLPQNVNAWVATQTNGLIPQILPTGGNYSDIVAVIANVVYFKGQWANGFPTAGTLSLPFTLADGTQTMVPTMQQSNSFPYFRGLNFQAVDLPYGQGRLGMLIVLPDPGVDLAGFVAAIRPSDIDTWADQMPSQIPVNITLPRFTASFGKTLVPALTTLGMTPAFDRTAAGLSGIYPGAFISDIEHKTVVEVDESGTVAAGATTVTIVTTGAAPSVNLQIDHPFFYAIRDNATGELLFVGVLMNPSAD